MSVFTLALLVVIWDPSLILNTPMLHWAALRFAPPAWAEVMTKLTLEVESKSFFKKQFTLQGHNLCYVEPGKNRLCSDFLDLEAGVDLAQSPYFIEIIKRFRLKNLSGSLNLPPQETHELTPEASGLKSTVAQVLRVLEGWQLPTELRNLEFEGLDVGLLQIELRLGSGSVWVNGDLSCRSPPDQKNLECGVDLVEQSGATGLPQYATLTARLRSIEKNILRPEVLRLQAKAQMRSQERLEATLGLDRRGRERWQMDLQVRGGLEAVSAHLKLNGELTTHGFQAMVGAEAQSSSESFPSVRLTNCLVSTRFKEGAEQLPSGNVDCKVRLQVPAEIRTARREFLSERWIPLLLGVRFFPVSGRKKAILHVATELQLQSENPILFAPEGWVRAQFEAPPADLFSIAKHELSCHIDFKKIPFADVKVLLAQQGITVPAPLSALRGDLGLRLQCQNLARQDSFVFPWALHSRLGSQNQVLNLSGEGKVELTPGPLRNRMEVSAQVQIQAGQLILPTLDITQLPAFFPSDAFGKPSPSPQSDRSMDVHYDVNLKTVGQPLFVLTNLARSPVPITLDLSLQDDRPLEGKVLISDVRMELFRRRATVEYMDFYLVPGKEAPDIRAQLRFQQPGYRIYLTLTGTTENPIATVSSNPPLPPDEAISVLLFGAPQEAVSLEEQQSVQSTRSLLVSRSVNLLSLYLFASTPIQKVDFDPEAGEISASIEATDRLTVRIGAAEREEGAGGIVGIRRRIGNSWAIVTELESGGSEENSSASAWLEWSKRY